MTTETSLNVLGVSKNSTWIGASLMAILVTADISAGKLAIAITDNGCGMAPKRAAHVTDLFLTTRTAREVGSGISSFKYVAENIGGSLHIESEPGKGTTVTAVFRLPHTDRTPLGDMNVTMHNLIVCHPDTDFFYAYTYSDASFTLGTGEMREILGEIPLNTPKMSTYIMEYLKENQQETDGGALT